MAKRTKKQVGFDLPKPASNAEPSVKKKKSPSLDDEPGKKSGVTDNSEELAALSDIYKDQNELFDKMCALEDQKRKDPNFKPEQKDLDEIQKGMDALNEKIKGHISSGLFDANRDKADAMLARIGTFKDRMDKELGGKETFKERMNKALGGKENPSVEAKGESTQSLGNLSPIPDEPQLDGATNDDTNSCKM